MFRIDNVDEYNDLQVPIVILEANLLVVIVRGFIVRANEMVIDDVDEEGENIDDIS